MGNIEEKNNFTYDCLVIGAGISGVSFAAQLSRQGQRVLLLEKNERIGGQIHSAQSTLADDFWLEMGAHTCYNSYTRLLRLADELGIGGEAIALGRGGYVAYSKDKIKSLPTQVSYIPFFTHFLNYFRADRTGKTVREFFSPIVAPVNYERIFSKAFRAVICQPADDYPAELFLKKRAGRNESFPRKYSFPGGISSLLQQLVERSGTSVAYGVEVVHISAASEAGYEIKTADGTIYTTQRVALATDPRTASVLLQTIEPGFSRLLEEVKMAVLSTIGVVVRKEATPIKHLAGIIPATDAFMSVVSRDLLPHDAYRGFAFHFMEPDVSFENKQELITRVLQVKKEDILETHHLKHVLPALRLDNVGLIERLDKVRSREDIYLIGNYFYGLSLEDCVNRADDEVARYA